MALQLSLRPRNPKTLTNPSLINLFSSNSSAASDPNAEPADSSSSASTASPRPPMSSYFSDLKNSLKHHPRSPSPPDQSPPPSKAPSSEEIRKNLSAFRSRSSVPPPSELGSTPSSSASSPWQRGISFQELYKRNAMRNGEDGNAPADSTKGGRTSVLPFDSIRKSLRQVGPSRAMQIERKSEDSISLSAFTRNSLNLKPDLSTPVFGETETGLLASSGVGKEVRGRKGGENERMKTEFVMMYSHDELGSKLRALRPDEAKEKNWFSLTELNERLLKLREMEEKEATSRNQGSSIRGLRESLVQLKISDEHEKKPKIATSE